MNSTQIRSDSFSQTQEESQPLWKKNVFKSPLKPNQSHSNSLKTNTQSSFLPPPPPSTTSQSRKRNHSNSELKQVQSEDEENQIEKSLLISSEPDSNRLKSKRNGSTSSIDLLPSSKDFISSSPERQRNSSSPPSYDYKYNDNEGEEVEMELTPLQNALLKHNEKLRSKPTWATEMEIDGERESEKEVARLTTRRGGRSQVLALQLNKPFLVGRHWRCDYVVPDPRVSAYHFKLFAHLTDSGDIFVVLEDTSRNGLLWNGNPCNKKSVILSDGDKIQIPNSQSFDYVHVVNDFERVGDNLLEKTTTVDKYILLNRILGTGSYAKVFLAYDTSSARQVACKRQTIPSSDKSAKKNLKREVQLLKQMQHPNINRLFDQLEDGGHVYLFVNLVAGGDLFNYVAKHRRLADAESKFITYQIVLAVQYLHQQGIAHRDLKPENVLLLTTGIDRFPYIQLGDFGLAFKDEVEKPIQAATSKGKRGSGRPRKNQSSQNLEKVSKSRAKSKNAGKGSSSSTGGKNTSSSDKVEVEKDLNHLEENVNIRASSTCGTVSYLPPEAFIIRVTKETYDPLKLDIWGIGCIVFVMLCGHHPFDHHSVDTPEDINHIIRARLVLDSIYTKSFFSNKLSPTESQDLEYMMRYCKRKDDEIKGVTSKPSQNEMTDSQADEEARFHDKFELVTNVIQINWSMSNILPADPVGNGGTGIRGKGKGKEKEKSSSGTNGIKKEAYDLVSSIFQFSPSVRPSCKGILNSTWINQSLKELQNLYQAKVSKA